MGGLGYVAQRWLGLHPYLAVAALAAWIAKDALLFRFVRHAYSLETRQPTAELLGARATATEPLAPEGFVRLGAELWRARLAPGSHPVPAGDAVVVESVEGLTLRVRATRVTPRPPPPPRPGSAS